MLILGLETSTGQSSVCLATEGGPVATASLGAAGARTRAHAEFLAPAIAFCLAEARVGVAAVTGVAVGLGPGLFTGMRVGLATAQALAHARGLPVVGVASLDLLAAGARHARWPVCAAVDARRGELFWAFYRDAGAGPGGAAPRRLGEFRVGPVARLAEEVEALRPDGTEPDGPGADGTGVLCVGDGAVAHRALLTAAGAEVGSPMTAHPSAQVLCELALPRFAAGDTGRPETLLPIYVREPDARIGWQGRGALHGGTAAPVAAGARDSGRVGG